MAKNEFFLVKCLVVSNILTTFAAQTTRNDFCSLAQL